MSRSSSIIHWKESRELVQTSEYRILKSSYRSDADHENEIFLEKLKLFADVTVAPKKKIEINEFSKLCRIIIPLVGSLELTKNDSTILLEPGAFFAQYFDNQQLIVIQNPYESEHINFLEICLVNDSAGNNLTGRFDLDHNLNNLLELNVAFSGKIHIGKFSIKEEFLLKFDSGENAYFFVISGSFEVNGMLLNHRDSASFFRVAALDFESLSPESIAVVVVM